MMSNAKHLKMTTVLFVILLLTGHLAEASVSLGLKSAWSGIQRALKAEKAQRKSPHITVHYPSGAVKDYLWTAARPFLWSYVCRYCTYLPERCEGDMTHCKINLRKVSLHGKTLFSEYLKILVHVRTLLEPLVARRDLFIHCCTADITLLSRFEILTFNLYLLSNFYCEQ